MFAGAGEGMAATALDGLRVLSLRDFDSVVAGATPAVGFEACVTTGGRFFFDLDAGFGDGDFFVGERLL